ncbi:hypothetical protein ACIQV3_01030 [Streptomyces sp. NPDC099050]|uniref:hypothetical protein n=1 Tax=Streptomyces sp. NPDC099050 TaxID=3366100 RepID=UPI0037F17CB5
MRRPGGSYARPPLPFLLRSCPVPAPFLLRPAAVVDVRQDLPEQGGDVLVPATALGLGIGPAFLGDEGSTLVVVANALRLLRYAD